MATLASVQTSSLLTSSLLTSSLLTAALLSASYPLALAGHLSIELIAGDALLIREWQYGSQRTVAAELVHGWVASLLYVAGAWIVLVALRRGLGRAYAATVLAVCLGLLAAAIAQAIPVPPVLAWLAFACFLLEALGRAVSRPRAASCA